MQEYLTYLREALVDPNCEGSLLHSIALVCKKTFSTVIMNFSTQKFTVGGMITQFRHVNGPIFHGVSCVLNEWAYKSRKPNRTLRKNKYINGVTLMTIFSNYFFPTNWTKDSTIRWVYNMDQNDKFCFVSYVTCKTLMLRNPLIHYASCPRYKAYGGKSFILVILRLY